MSIAFYVDWNGGTVFVPPKFIDPNGNYSEYAPCKPYWTTGEFLTDEELSAFLKETKTNSDSL